MENNIILLIDSAAGQYIPKEFMESTGNVPGWVYGVSEETLETLKNPDDSWYWESWNDVLNNAVFTDSDGKEYTLHQDGDLWAICFKDLTDEEKENFNLSD